MNFCGSCCGAVNRPLRVRSPAAWQGFLPPRVSTRGGQGPFLFLGTDDIAVPRSHASPFDSEAPSLKHRSEATSAAGKGALPCGAPAPPAEQVALGLAQTPRQSEPSGGGRAGAVPGRQRHTAPASQQRPGAQGAPRKPPSSFLSASLASALSPAWRHVTPAPTCTGRRREPRGAGSSHPGA